MIPYGQPADDDSHASDLRPGDEGTVAVTSKDAAVEARTERRFDCGECGKNVAPLEHHTYTHCVLHKAGVKVEQIEQAIVPHGPNGECSNPDLCLALIDFRLAIEDEAALAQQRSEPAGDDALRCGVCGHTEHQDQCMAHMGGPGYSACRCYGEAATPAADDALFRVGFEAGKAQADFEESWRQVASIIATDPSMLERYRADLAALAQQRSEPAGLDAEALRLLRAAHRGDWCQLPGSVWNDLDRLLARLSEPQR